MGGRKVIEMKFVFSSLKVGVIAAYIMSLSSCSSAMKRNEVLTPRQKYITEYNYLWDMKTPQEGRIYGVPFFGAYPLVEFMKYESGCFESNRSVHTLNRCSEINFDGDFLNYFTLDQARDEYDRIYFRHGTSVYPYSKKDLSEGPVYLAVVGHCEGVFKTIERPEIFKTDLGYGADGMKIELQIKREREIAASVFTSSFLDYIDASQDLKDKILDVGILSPLAVSLFRDSWKSGDLDHPALAISTGGCGAGEVEVEVKFKESTDRFQIITDFDYLLCIKDERDPWDPDKCPHVRDKMQNVILLSGKYRIRVIRSSGEVIERAIEISGNEGNKMEI